MIQWEQEFSYNIACSYSSILTSMWDCIAPVAGHLCIPIAYLLYGNVCVQ